MAFKHLALFNGIGGFQLAASWMGWENVAHVEINPWCNEVVKQHFPESKCYTDIKQFDGTQYKGTIDIITGGFPCQPFSTAGSRKGNEDDRYLWPEMLRVIREIQPTYIVAENVYGIINQGNGMVFETVCSQMEDAGYEVQPFIIPACAIGAQIRRDRVWFVGRLSNSSGIRFQGDKEFQEGQQHRARWEAQHFIDPLYRISRTEYRRGESTFNGGINGVSGELDELEAIGNAIVPQLAFCIFRAVGFFNAKILHQTSL